MVLHLVIMDHLWDLQWVHLHQGWDHHHQEWGLQEWDLLQEWYICFILFQIYEFASNGSLVCLIDGFWNDFKN
jgi:hypothetical protein